MATRIFSGSVCGVVSSLIKPADKGKFKINNLEREIGDSVLVAWSGGVSVRMDDVQFGRKSWIFEQRKRPHLMSLGAVLGQRSLV